MVTCVFVDWAGDVLLFSRLYSGCRDGDDEVSLSGGLGALQDILD